MREVPCVEPQVAQVINGPAPSSRRGSCPAVASKVVGKPRRSACRGLYRPNIPGLRSGAHCCTNKGTGVRVQTSAAAFGAHAGLGRRQVGVGADEQYCAQRHRHGGQRAAANTAIVPPALSPASVGLGRTGPSSSGAAAAQRATLKRSSTAAGAGSSGARRKSTERTGGRAAVRGPAPRWKAAACGAWSATPAGPGLPGLRSRGHCLRCSPPHR